MVGMKPLSERDENLVLIAERNYECHSNVGMKPLSERDENYMGHGPQVYCLLDVGMKPLSERDEN